QGRGLCRRLHAGHPLEQRRYAVRALLEGSLMQGWRSRNLASVAIAALVMFFSVSGHAADDGLELEVKIALGEVRGRIDHFAVDARRQRLFVAELGNDTIGVIDLEKRKLLRTIAGLSEPQGVGYVASTDTLYVANACGGSVRLFQGADY